MKKDIHPSNYREVVFKDMSNGDTFITRSTVAARETIDIDGVTYPLVKLEITNTSGRSRRQVHEPLRQSPQEVRRKANFYILKTKHNTRQHLSGCRLVLCCY